MSFIVCWIGMDGHYYEDEQCSLDKARSHAIWLSEVGGHCISIIDDDCNEHPW